MVRKDSHSFINVDLKAEYI